MHSLFKILLEKIDMPDYSDAKQISGPLGVSPGGVFEDNDGRRVYLKTTEDQENTMHLRSEAAAAQLANAAGIRTLTPRLVTRNGQLYLASKWNPNLKKLPDVNDLTPHHLENDLPKHYVLAAATNNYDVIGYHRGNAMVDDQTKRIVGVDYGVSFGFTAKGHQTPYTADSQLPHELIHGPIVQRSGPYIETAAKYFSAALPHIPKAVHGLSVNGGTVHKTLLDHGLGLPFADHAAEVFDARLANMRAVHKT